VVQVRSVHFSKSAFDTHNIKEEILDDMSIRVTVQTGSRKAKL
jgi:hypothetical protein